LLYPDVYGGNNRLSNGRTKMTVADGNDS
jgi:hypothetical protein